MTWDRAHTTTHNDPLGHQKPLNKWFGVGPFAAPGGRETRNAMGTSIGPAPWAVSYGPSTRRAIDFAQPSQSPGISPLGQSDVLFDAQYREQASTYVSGGYVRQWLDPADVLANTGSVLILSHSTARGSLMALPGRIRTSAQLQFVEAHNGVMVPIGRRLFVVATGAILSQPLVGRSQRADKLRRIGFLSSETADSEGGQLARKLIPEALKQRGWIEGDNLVIEWRWSNGKIADLPELAAALVRNKVEIIVARTNFPILAAMKATQTIPIVMLNGNFPVEAGLVQSLARPGGNVTGTSYLASAELFAKHLQILQDLAPSTDRVAVLRNANELDNPVVQSIMAVQKRTASQLGMTVHMFDIRQADDVPAALNAIAASGIKAMFYGGDPIMRTRTTEIMRFLHDQKMASIAIIPTFAEAGGLAHFSPIGSDFYDRTASYIDRILKGAKPSDLPVEEPTRFDFVINLKTARAIGLPISQSLRLRADRLIE